MSRSSVSSSSFSSSSTVRTSVLMYNLISNATWSDAIVKGLTGIREDVESGVLQITEEYEDIHSFVEANLIERIGEAL